MQSASISATELAKVRTQLERALADDDEAWVTWPAEDVMRLVTEIARLRDELTRQATMHGGVYVHDADWQPEDLW